MQDEGQTGKEVLAPWAEGRQAYTETQVPYVHTLKERPRQSHTWRNGTVKEQERETQKRAKKT